MSKRIRPGDLVKDTITGAEGVVVCVAEWQFGCFRVTVQPKAVKDNRPVDCFTVDLDQLAVVAEETKERPPVTGGGRDAPEQHEIPEQPPAPR